MKFFKTEIQVFTDYVRQHDLLTSHLRIALHFAENLLEERINEIFCGDFYKELDSAQEIRAVCLEGYTKAENNIQQIIAEDFWHETKESTLIVE